MAKPNALSSYYFSKEVGTAVGGGMGQSMVTPKFDGNLHLGVGIQPLWLDVATPCTFIPATIVVTSIPQMYLKDGKPTPMGILIKNLLESHAKAVSGIDFGYTLGNETNANVGHDGQQFAVPTKTTRAAVNPSFTFTELSGNLVWNCFKRWIWDINHPDTNASMAQVQFPGAYTMSAYACSFMVIQFDPTMRPDRIIDAAHYANVWPTETGTIGFERTIGQIKSPERSINFTGIVQHNSYIKAVAIEIAKRLRLHVHNYDMMIPHKFQIEGFDEEPNSEGHGINREIARHYEQQSITGVASLDDQALSRTAPQPDQFVATEDFEKPRTGVQVDHPDAFVGDHAGGMYARTEKLK